MLNQLLHLYFSGGGGDARLEHGYHFLIKAPFMELGTGFQGAVEGAREGLDGHGGHATIMVA
jgi:hypothetical protein